CAVCGVALPAGLRQAARLPQTIFTPAAKAEFGSHDENVDFAHVVAEVGPAMAEDIRRITLELYAQAAHYAAGQGIIIADTKFEFGLDETGRLHLMDEVLTPDSSRFWPTIGYAEGISPPSFDKQFVRDWLETQTWDKTPPAPRLPADVIERTSAKYQEALTRLTQEAST
ncbi:MAG: phosphoribosylaminoimidazolesuccinocarboxamide synthase, partial [Alcaligenaceae bacterium]|nr:phosphoribosylaminoimidazolesuccinocarboxamide synthase [Alcaligenaceae bacterium]